MHKVFSTIAPTRRKRSQRVHTGRSNLHDSNEDILRIIKLYNQGTMKTINDDEALKPKQYPYLLKYRATNLYVYLTAALSILSSVYMNYSLTCITPTIIKNQIKASQKEPLNDDIIEYVASCFYFSGILGGSLLFGWLGCQVRQRKYAIMSGILGSIIAGSTLVASIDYWMFFPAKFLQGISNACIWILSAALIADAWPVSKWESMVGFIGGLFPLGIMTGLLIGAISNYVNYHISFYFALGCCIFIFFAQFTVIERSTIPESWLLSTAICLEDETEMEEHNYRDMQRDTLDVVRRSWSKSSSLSTINLREQPINFEKERNSFDSIRSAKHHIYNSIIFRIMTSITIITLIYQTIVMASVLGSLKYSLLEKLDVQMNITNPTYQSIIVSTFLFPFSVSAFFSGWFCNMFGPKIVGLASIIICIPALIWIGVPNQIIQSIVSALALSGFTFGSMMVSILVSIIRAIQKVQLYNEYDLTKQQQQSLHREKSSVVFAFILVIFGVGLFSSYFLSKLNQLIGFLWLCFSLAMLIGTCIPFMAYFLKNQTKNSIAQISFHPNTSGKSNIINNTRPESLDESVSDDESTVGSSSKSACNVTLESKSSVVVP